ncbi:hypothetical protein K474DRAFT_678681 [Panus rudis PR-1116 ss-1]|nr:hypothetical protein K474DRAFT_678681 [Panus rudis PR-1116 ss-1]
MKRHPITLSFKATYTPCTREPAHTTMNFTFAFTVLALLSAALASPFGARGTEYARGCARNCDRDIDVEVASSLE